MYKYVFFRCVALLHAFVVICSTTLHGQDLQVVEIVKEKGVSLRSSLIVNKTYAESVERDAAFTFSLHISGDTLVEDDIKTVNDLVREGRVKRLDMSQARASSWNSLSFGADDDNGYSDIPLEAVALPRGMRHIPPRFANGVRRLRELQFPDSVVTIGRQAFRSTDVEAIYPPEGLKTIQYEAFCSCKHLKKVELPWTLEQLEERAFVKCPELQLFVLKSNANVNLFTFYEEFSPRGNMHGRNDWDDMTHIGKVILPASFTPFADEVLHVDESDGWGDYDMKVMSGNAAYDSLVMRSDLCNRVGMLFYNADTLVINPDNPHFLEDDGVLYDSTHKFMLRYSPQRRKKTFHIPDGVVLTMPCFPLKYELDTLVLPHTQFVPITRGSSIGVCPIIYAFEVQDTKFDRPLYYRSLCTMHRIQVLVIPSEIEFLSPLAVYYFNVRYTVFLGNRLPALVSPIIWWHVQNACTYCMVYRLSTPFWWASNKDWYYFYGDLSSNDNIDMWVKITGSPIVIRPLSEYPGLVSVASPADDSPFSLVRGGVIFRGTEEMVSIYDTGGTLLRKQRVGDGATIPLSPGRLYIAVVGNRRYKVVVW